METVFWVDWGLQGQREVLEQCTAGTGANTASQGLPNHTARDEQGPVGLNSSSLQQCTQGASQHHPLYPSPVVVPEEIVLELQFVAALNLKAVRKQQQTTQRAKALGVRCCYFMLCFIFSDSLFV